MEIVNMIARLPWHKKRRWGTRDLLVINKVIIHQELSDGHIEQVNDYHITPGPNNHISQKGAPHFCYHFGIRMTDHDGHPEGEIVQANELTNITWHTTGQNETGIGIMLEGNFKGIGHELGNDGPTEKQIDSLEWLVSYLLGSLKLTNQDVYGHYQFGKPYCPGYEATDWIERYRNREVYNDKNSKEIKGIASIKELQKSLTKLNYKLGKADGVIGPNTKAAIRAFQRDFGLTIDGVPGPQTRKRLIAETAKEVKNE